MIEAKVKGLADINEALAELPNKVGKKVLVAALKKAAGPVAVAANANAATYRHTGELSESFTVKTSLSRRQRRKIPMAERQQAVVYVGSTDWKAHFFEFGTGPHVIARDLKDTLASKSAVYGREVLHPGMPARPLLRPAWDGLKASVVDEFGKLIWKEIEKVKKKLAK